MKTFYIKKGPIYLVSLYLIQTCSMAITKYFQIKTIFRNLFINRLLIGWIIYLLWLLSLTELLLKRLFHQDLDPVKKWILWLWYFLSIGNRLNNAPSYGNAIDRWNLKYAVCVEISVSANGSGILIYPSKWACSAKGLNPIFRIICIPAVSEESAR